MLTQSSKPVLLTVSGETRSGKDTLIKNIVTALTLIGIRATIASSIDPVKEFVLPLMEKMGFPSDGGLLSRHRQTLSDVKKALDANFQFTVRYPSMTADHSFPVIYQVREVENIEALRRQGYYTVLAILVRRRDNRPVECADTDKPPDANLFDYIIESHPSDMEIYAKIIAAKVSRLITGVDVS